MTTEWSKNVCVRRGKLKRKVLPESEAKKVARALDGEARRCTNSAHQLQLSLLQPTSFRPKEEYIIFNSRCNRERDTILQLTVTSEGHFVISSTAQAGLQQLVASHIPLLLLFQSASQSFHRNPSEFAFLFNFINFSSSLIALLLPAFSYDESSKQSIDFFLLLLSYGDRGSRSHVDLQ